MGRRKIEIKAIKDDRNRSVTFLKRKGGLFKKAHELSVLCSVDVAVIIFGHNKKLYEFSSGDINETIGRYQYYGGPHEHKGPADFAGKRDLDGSDDEEIDEGAIENEMEQSIPQIQHNQNFARMRHAPSASPPIGNGAVPYNRQRTPQPGMGSRPSSRNHNPIPRPPSALNQVTNAPSIANGYAYMANGVYNPHAPPGMPGGPHPAPQHPPQPQPQFQAYNGMHQMPQFMPDQRRGSMPPYAQNDRLQPQPPLKTERHSASPPQQPQEIEQRNNNNLQPQQQKSTGTKSRSIFTPIADRGSLLAQHWGLGTTPTDAMKQEFAQDQTRPQSVDVGSVQHNGTTQPPGPSKPPQRVFSQPQRTQSITSLSGDTKRPRLKVQIPSEQSDDGASPTGGSSPSHQQQGPTSNAASNDRTDQATDPQLKNSNTGTTQSSGSGGSGVVLPPPSPSASAILSAGAQGPPNPFARPLPPGSNNNASAAAAAANQQNSSAYANNSNIETPISALPSRFLQDGMLPSPSSFYPEWGFGRSADGSGNLLPSPLNFQTPVVGSGPGFGGAGGKEDEGSDLRKRKSIDEEKGVGVEGGGAKRIKAEI